MPLFRVKPWDGETGIPIEFQFRLGDPKRFSGSFALDGPVGDIVRDLRYMRQFRGWDDLRDIWFRHLVIGP